MFADERLEPQTGVVLSLTTASGLFTLREPAVVRRVQPHAKGGYLLGCELDRTLTPGELSALLA